MRQPHQPPLPNTTLQICIAPKTEPLVVVYAYDRLGSAVTVPWFALGTFQHRDMLASCAQKLLNGSH